MRVDAERPLVSVIVPVRNRPKAIEACLAALSRLRYPRELLEVIVVDDASTDETAAVAERLADRVLRLPSHGGQSSARNAGVEAAHGSLVAFTDSDCVPDPGWLDLLVAELEEPGVAAAGGGVAPLDDSTRLQRYEEVRSPQHLGDRPARVWPGTAVSYLASCNLVIRRDELLDAGGFDPDLHVGEDVDLVWRLCARGAEIRYRPNGLVRHYHRDRLWPFLRRRAFYASAEPLLLRRHPANMRSLFVPPGVAAALAWVGITLAAGQPRLAPIGGLPALAELALTWRRGPAVWARGIASFLYQSALNVSRYYTVPILAVSLVAAAFWSHALWIVAALCVLLLAPALVDWLRLRPRLSLPSFVAAYVLDNLAYHVGVLLASARHRTLGPLALRLRWRGARPGPLQAPEPVRSP